MKHLHAKSLCCKASVRRFGSRRRQCCECGKTWSIRQKKRGRKKCRTTPQFASRYLDRQLPSLRSLAEIKSIPRETVRRRFQASLQSLVGAATWKSVPSDGRLIALADAFYIRIQYQVYTCYLILLKRIGNDEAVICSPLFRLGREDLTGWSAAFEGLPRSVLQRICALVCDGNMSLRGMAIRYKWFIQRCHFHLLKDLQNYISSGPHSRHKLLALLLYPSINEALCTTSQRQLNTSLEHLRTVTMTLIKNKSAIKYLKGFLKHYREYRTYLRHPHLELPRTTGACESLVQCVRDVFYRIHGCRTIEAFMRWTEARLLEKKTMTVRGFFQQK